MPRFYFNVRDGYNIADADGVELADLERHDGKPLAFQEPCSKTRPINTISVRRIGGWR